MILRKESEDGYLKLLYLDKEDSPEEEIRKVSRAIVQIASDEALNELASAIIRSAAASYGMAYGNYRLAEKMPYKSEIRRKEDIHRAKRELKKEKEFFLYSNLMAALDIDPVRLMKKVEKNIRDQQRFLEGDTKNAGNQTNDQRSGSAGRVTKQTCRRT